MLLTLLAEITLFVPGIIVFMIFSKLKNINATTIEKIIAGVILWNYIFCCGSILIGLIPHALKLYFKAYFLLSILILLSVPILIFIHVKKSSHMTRGQIAFSLKAKKPPKLLTTKMLSLVFTASVMSVIALLSMNTKLSSTWDVWAIWIPISKSIAGRGDILQIDYLTSPFYMRMKPPFMPLLNAYTLSISGELSCIYPIIYCILLALIIFELARNVVTDTENAYRSIVAYASSPLLFAMLMSFPLNPDLIGTIFFWSSFFYIYMLGLTKRSNKTTWLILFGMSISLLMLVKEIGIVLSFLLLLFFLLLLPLPARVSKALFVVLWLVASYYIAQESKVPLLLLIPLLIPLCFLLSRLDSNDVSKLKSMREISPLLIILSFPVSFFIITGYTSGLWFYIVQQDPAIYLKFVNLTPQNPKEPTFTELLVILMRIDDFLLRYFLLPYVPPVILGLGGCLRRKLSSKEKMLILLLLLFFSIIICRYFEYYPSYVVSYVGNYSFVRRIFIFMPILIILSHMNLNKINAKKSHQLCLFTSVYFLVSLMYVFYRISNHWTRPFTSLENIGLLYVPIGTSASLFDLLFVLFAYITFYLIDRFLLQHLSKRRLYFMALIFLIVICILFQFFSLLLTPMREAIEKGQQVRFKPPSFAEDVVTYFNSFNKTKDFRILGYQVYYLATYADIKVIDLSIFYGYCQFEDIFINSDNLEEISLKLRTLNVKYFVLPNENYWNYKIFRQQYIENFPIFSEFVKKNLRLQISLKYFDVYTIQDS